MTEKVTAAILFVIAMAAFIMSYFSFKEKGFLLNNAYIHASRRKRENMDKKPYYRQSAIVFFLIGIIFLLNAMEVVLKRGWTSLIVLVLLILTLVYAIQSSITINRKE